MNGFAVFERDDAKYTQFTVTRVLNFDPVANAPIFLGLAPSGAISAAAHHARRR